MDQDVVVGFILYVKHQRLVVDVSLSSPLGCMFLIRFNSMHMVWLSEIINLTHLAYISGN